MQPDKQHIEYVDEEEITPSSLIAAVCILLFIGLAYYLGTHSLYATKSVKTDIPVAIVPTEIPVVTAFVTQMPTVPPSFTPTPSASPSATRTPTVTLTPTSTDTPTPTSTTTPTPTRPEATVSATL